MASEMIRRSTVLNRMLERVRAELRTYRRSMDNATRFPNGDLYEKGSKEALIIAIAFLELAEELGMYDEIKAEFDKQGVELLDWTERRPNE